MENGKSEKKMTYEQAILAYENTITRYQVIAPTARHIRLFNPLPTELSSMAITVFYRICTVDHLQQYTGRLVVDARNFPSEDSKPLTSKDIVKIVGFSNTPVYRSLKQLCAANVFKHFSHGFIVNPLYATASPMVYAVPEVRNGHTYYNYAEQGTGIDEQLYNEFGVKRVETVELLADIPILPVPTEEEQKLDDEIIKRAWEAEYERQALAEGAID